MATRDISIYYDKGQMLSHRCFLNFIVGNRGGGKTFGGKAWSVEDFEKTVKEGIEYGRQFLWVRRYCTEIHQMRRNFFDDIAPKFPKIKFKVTGNDKFGKFYANDKCIGFYIALSVSAIAKSMAFPQVDKIIFDEFLIIGNTYHYLSDEVVLFLELIETVFRDRENNPDAKIKPRGVYLLGNNITIANPYFLYFGIKPNPNHRFTIFRDKGILIEMYTNEEFIKEKKKSKIGRLTQGTTYAEYSIENKAYLDNDTFIGSMTPASKFRCSIDYGSKTYGFWIDYKQGYMFANMKYDPDSYNHYSLTRDDHTTNTFLIKSRNSTYISDVIWFFQNGCLYFENQQVKNQVYEILAHFVK